MLILLFVFGFFSVFSDFAQANRGLCELPAQPFSIGDDRGKGWDLEYSDDWFLSPQIALPKMLPYQQGFQAVEPRTQMHIIQNHRTVVADFLARATHPVAIKANTNYLANIDFVLKSKASQIRSLSCLESGMFLEIYYSGDNRSVPLDREYQWYVLRKGQTLRVLRSNPGDSTSVFSLWFSFEISKLVTAGWQVLMDMHNHPRMAPHLVPSPDDHDSWESNLFKWNVTKLVISNGFQTLEFSAADMDSLNGSR